MSEEARHFLRCGGWVLVGLAIHVANLSAFFALNGHLGIILPAMVAALVAAVYGLASVISPLITLPLLMPASVIDSDEAGPVLAITTVLGLVFLMFATALPWID